MTLVQRRIAKTLIFIGCSLPLMLLLLRGLGYFGTLGANPAQEVLHVLGTTGLNILLITLAISPLRRLTHYNGLVVFRRMVGLFSFFYLSLHFLSYLWLDLEFAFDMLWFDTLERPYITVGMAALALMIPLAVTSTRGMQRRLKRRWTSLHQLIYPIALLAVLHFLWQTKLDVVSDSIIYSAILIILLGERAARRIARTRKRQLSPATH